MSCRQIYTEVLDAGKKQTPYERLQIRLAHQELLVLCSQKKSEDLKAAYEETIRFFA